MLSVVVAVAALGWTASEAAAQTTVRLIAAPVTKDVTLPNGTTVSVPMWGYALDTAPQTPTARSNAGETVTVPGPRIVVPPGDTTLTIKLTNCLPETDLAGHPRPAVHGRAREKRRRARPVDDAGDGCAAAPETYTFTGLKPGTLPVPERVASGRAGADGPLRRDDEGRSPPATPTRAFAYAHEAVLVYSEIDQALHQAVCPSIVGGACSPGTYGTPSGPTSTIDYRPSLFLINGESYTEAMATIAAGTAGEATLLRLLNAGLRTHAPVLDNGSLRIVAEDGNKLPFAKDQAAVMLAAGKTHDALWTPAAAGTYSLYDRTLGLNAPGQGEAGHAGQAERVGGRHRHDGVCERRQLQHERGCAPSSFPRPAYSRNDTGTPDIGDARDARRAMERSLWRSNGGFTYTPAPGFFGIDSFTYRASNGSQRQPAGDGRHRRRSSAAAAGRARRSRSASRRRRTCASPSRAATRTAIRCRSTSPRCQPSGGTSATQGTLSYIDPLTKVETPLTAADLHTVRGDRQGDSGRPRHLQARHRRTSGPRAFTFVAFDGAPGIRERGRRQRDGLRPAETSAADLTQSVDADGQRAPTARRSPTTAGRSKRTSPTR